MKTSRWKQLCAAVLILISTLDTYAQADSVLIRKIIESSPIVSGGRETAHAKEQITAFYQSNHYRLAWRDAVNIVSLIEALRHAEDEGLSPNDYHYLTIQRLYIQNPKTNQEQILFDVLLTDAFLSYASHLFYGKADPKKIFARSWEPQIKVRDFRQLLKEALTGRNVLSALESVKPRHEGYKKLKEALRLFKKLQAESDWPSIRERTALRCGDSNEQIPQIRKRLFLTGHIQPHALSESFVYDSVLFTTIKTFQTQHGLVADGIIGKDTYTALNYTATDYVQTILVNLERYRWLADDIKNRGMVINIPAFTAEVRENDSLMYSMKVIVGKPQRKTPVLESSLNYIILNPTWTVPPTILREDVLPAVKRNIDYLSKHKLRVVTPSGQEVDPSVLPWATYTSRNFPYFIRQDPGEYNALGLIKFQFPNNYTVFLHDTNTRALFNETSRALSSGCIRIEHPFALAVYLLKGDPLWNAEKLNPAILSRKTQTIVIKNPLRVSIVYFTAFVDANNNFNIRPDIYGYDKLLRNALEGGGI